MNSHKAYGKKTSEPSDSKGMVVAMGALGFSILHFVNALLQDASAAAPLLTIHPDALPSRDFDYQDTST